MNILQYILAGPLTFLAIIGVLFVIVFALKSFHKKFPQFGERIMNATPSMGWSEVDDEITETPYRSFNRLV